MSPAKTKRFHFFVKKKTTNQLPMVAVSSKFTESQVSGWPDQGGFHQGRRTEPGLEEIDCVFSG